MWERGKQKREMLNILNSSSIMPTFNVFKLWRQKNETNLEHFLLFWTLDKKKVLIISCIFPSILCHCTEIVVDTKLLTPRQPSAALISPAPVRDKDNKRRGDCFLCSCWRQGPLEAMPHFSWWWLTRILTIDSAYDVKMHLDGTLLTVLQLPWWYFSVIICSEAIWSHQPGLRWQ